VIQCGVVIRRHGDGQVVDCVELCEAVEQHDEQLTARLLPVVKQRLDKSTQALSDCLEVKDLVAHWYMSGHLCIYCIFITYMCVKSVIFMCPVFCGIKEIKWAVSIILRIMRVLFV